jgi:hypothetical protein
VGELARRCRKEKIRCIAIAGDLNASTGAKRFFAEARALTELTSVTKAKSNPAVWLERLAAQTAQKWAEQAKA